MFSDYMLTSILWLELWLLLKENMSSLNRMKLLSKNLLKDSQLKKKQRSPTTKLSHDLQLSQKTSKKIRELLKISHLMIVKVK